MPRRVIAWIAVQEQERRPGTAMAQADDGAFRAHVEMLETGEQPSDLLAPPARRIPNIIFARGLRHHCALLRCCRRGDVYCSRARGQCFHETAPAHPSRASVMVVLPGVSRTPAAVDQIRPCDHRYQ